MENLIKVLMVDDEEQFREKTKKILELRGFQVILAQSGPEALEKLEEKPHVAVIDYKMPGMDGYELLERIHDQYPKMPVIMLTGHGASTSARQALTKGAFDYLIKPCDITLLSSRIRDAYHQTTLEAPAMERLVSEVMVPIEDYTVLRYDLTIRDAVDALKESFSSKMATSRLMETGHRSVLVTDGNGVLVGLLSIRGLLRATIPAYITAPKPSMVDTLQYRPMFWRDMFTHQIKKLADDQIKTIMDPAPATIDAATNLMEAAYMLLEKNARRLAVLSKGELVGVIREQDLFFEMERILSNYPKQ
jgi:CheY-like chemotaxis protein